MRMQIEQWNDRDSDEGEAIDDYLKSVKWIYATQMLKWFYDPLG